jgi:hypothetical protein
VLREQHPEQASRRNQPEEATAFVHHGQARLTVTYGRPRGNLLVDAGRDHRRLREGCPDGRLDLALHAGACREESARRRRLALIVSPEPARSLEAWVEWVKRDMRERGVE